MAKLSSASIRLVQKMNRVNKYGEYPIYIVVCWKGRIEKACGVSCQSKYWDSKREIIKAACPNSPVLNKMLSDIKNRVIERKNDYEYKQMPYTASMLLEEYRVDYDGNSELFVDIYKSLAKDRALTSSTTRRYEYTYNKLCDFLNKKDFIVSELTTSKMKEFALWMERHGIKINTIKSLLGCVASVWNYAISKKLVSNENYPFKEFKYTEKYHEVSRDYFLERSHIIRLKEYFLNLVIEWKSDNLWTYRDGAYERLHKRTSAEFSILWFLMAFKMNGSAPIDLALLKGTDCKRVSINKEDYWAIDIRRKKTGRDVHIRFKRDILAIVGFEHFMGSMKNDGHVYPIVNWHDGITDKQIIGQCHHICAKDMKHIKKAFERINEDIARDNANNDGGVVEPLVEIDRLVFYTQRHSFAQQYLSSPNATVNGLASLMARSANTIATYVKQITRDEDIAEMSESFAI